jgi:hypothetical protein
LGGPIKNCKKKLAVAFDFFVFPHCIGRIKEIRRVIRKGTFSATKVLSLMVIGEKKHRKE